jgi:branched-chain amino acid transport system ATP-binding protein
VTYKNETISNLAPHLIVRKRICQAPEGRGIFLNLSVAENLDLGRREGAVARWCLRRR